MHLHIVKHVLVGTLACGLTLVVVGCTSVDADAESAPENVATTSQAISLGSSLGKPIWSDDTRGLYNGVTPSCVPSNASDMSFQWSAPSSGIFTFSTIGSSFDTVLVIASYNNPSSVLACAGSISGTGGESTKLTLTSGSQLLVTVDGYASLAGPFKLNITKDCLDEEGATYVHGESIAGGAGVRCSSKFDGFCIGGVFDGSPCVASGECYATCDNGTWV